MHGALCPTCYTITPVDDDDGGDSFKVKKGKKTDVYVRYGGANRFVPEREDVQGPITFLPICWGPCRCILSIQELYK